MQLNNDINELAIWYRDHSTTANRIINDLKKSSHEGMMHVYAYTANLLGLEHTASQVDFPTVFSNNYTRVGDTMLGLRTALLNEFNFNIGKNTINRTLAYWLLSGQMYHVLVSKLISVRDNTSDKFEKVKVNELIVRLVETSLHNGIQVKENWDKIIDNENATNITIIHNNVSFANYHSHCNHVENHFISQIELERETNSSNANEVKAVGKEERFDGCEEKKVVIPQELDNDLGRAILGEVIKQGLCDERYHWKKSKALLSYFAELACDHLQLSTAEQDGKKKISWMPFEQLFNYKDLKDCRNYRINKSASLPREHEKVDAIFEEISR